MKYQQKLIDKKLAILRAKEWYHQRFDGCPQFILLISMGELRRESRKGNGFFTSHLVIFENDRTDWYIDQEDIKRISEWFIAASKKKRNVSRKLLDAWRRDEKAFYSSCQTIQSLELDKLTDVRLKKLYHDFVEAYLKSISSSSLIDGFALGTDRILQSMITNYLIGIGAGSKRYDYFTKLTAPTNQSFINKAEVSLLNIGKHICKLKNAKSLFLKERSVIKILKILQKDSPFIYRLLDQHKNNYFWSKNNYVDDNVLGMKHFVKEIQGFIKGRVDFEYEVNRIMKAPKDSKFQKEKLVKELELPDDIKMLISISDDFTLWQDERKRKTYWLTHYLSLILGEISNRFGYTIHELKYLVPPEVESLFSKPTVSRITASKRIKKTLFCQYGTAYEMLHGAEADRYIKDVLRKEEVIQVNDFRGLPACRGIVEGRVKIIKSAKECGEVKEGDILVAVMTRPDYIVAMKKAKAIITNEGGITSHAAIVSRELGVPCVIGTKIATEVLKDGDRVEVNANHGIIKILQRIGP